MDSAVVLPFRRNRAERSDANDALARFKAEWQAQLVFQTGLHTEWQETIFYVHGRQYLSVNGEAGKPFVQRPQDSRRVRVQMNVMMRMAADHKAAYLARPPEWACRSLTNDTPDIIGARRSDDLVRYYEVALEMNTVKRRQMATSLVETGNGFYYYGYDKNAGETMTVRLPTGEVVQLKVGDIFCDFDMPQRWAFHPHALSVEMSPYGHRRVAMPRDMAAKLAPNFDLDQVPDLNPGESYTFWEHSLLGLPGGTTSWLGAQESMKPGEGFIEVFMRWSRPGTDSKKGLYMVGFGSGSGPTIVPLVEDNPYETIPCVHIKQVDVPGSLWGQCWMSQLRSPQRALNRGISQQIENGNLTANPQLVVPDDTLAPQTVTNRVGGVLKADPKGMWRPFYLIPPQMPAYHTQNIERSLSLMDVIGAPFGPSSSSRGQGSTSGAHLMRLQQENEAKLSDQIDAWEAGHVQIWNCLLKTFRVNARLPRRINGPVEGRWMDEYVSGKDLTEKIRYEITPRSTMPKDRNSAFAEHTEILKVVPELRTDQRFMNHFWEAIAYGSMVTEERDRRLDTDKAHHNILLCQQGVQPIPEEMDDASIHLPIYEAEMLTDAYRDLWDDDSKKALYALYQMFKRFEILKAAEQAQRAMLMAAIASGKLPMGAMGPGPTSGGVEPHQTEGMVHQASPFRDEGGNGGAGSPATPGMVG